MKKLEERAGGVYRASAGTAYPTLQLLEDEGLIASESHEGKRVYRLTDAGRKGLERLDEDVRHIWRRARRWDDWRAMFDPRLFLELVKRSSATRQPADTDGEGCVSVWVHLCLARLCSGVSPNLTQPTDAAELRGPAERLVKAAFRAVRGDLMKRGYRGSRPHLRGLDRPGPISSARR